MYLPVENKENCFLKDSFKDGIFVSTLNASQMNKQFPIGQPVYSENYSEQELQNWINDIALLPQLIRKEIEGRSEEILDVPYREGGWTVRQVIRHLLDSHSNALIRTKLALTEENPTIKPYEQDAWVQVEEQFGVPLELTLRMLEDTHQKLVLIYKSLSDEQWKRSYVNPESGSSTLSKSAALYAWHSNHHLAHIRMVTRAKV